MLGGEGCHRRRGASRSRPLEPPSPSSCREPGSARFPGRAHDGGPRSRRPSAPAPTTWSTPRMRACRGGRPGRRSGSSNGSRAWVVLRDRFQRAPQLLRRLLVAGRELRGAHAFSDLADPGRRAPRCALRARPRRSQRRRIGSPAARRRVGLRSSDARRALDSKRPLDARARRPRSRRTCSRRLSEHSRQARSLVPVSRRSTSRRTGC